jgi:hypothetical protein
VIEVSRILFLALLLCTSAARAQQVIDDVDEDEFVIRKRSVDAVKAPDKAETKPDPKIAERVAEKKAPPKEEKALIDLLGTKLSDAQYRAEIHDIAVMLLERKFTKEERDDLVLAVTREINRSSKAFGALLNWRTNPDVKLRLGAVEGIRLAYTGTVGTFLGASALSEPNPNVRNAVIKLIKDRNDRVAMKYLFQLLLSSVENGETTAITNSQLNSATLAALRDIGDKQVYEVLLFLERVSMANGITGTPYLDGVKIAPPNTDLQCMAPNSEVGMMQYTQTFPGLSALKAVSGENFGHDLKKWQDWIDKQPAYKP